jgi:spore coat protein JB
MKQRVKLLCDIQKEDFMVTELSLFLDTHPGDRRAVAEFNRHTQCLIGLIQTYEHHFGPLALHQRCTPVQYPWRWIEEPWPWEIEY